MIKTRKTALLIEFSVFVSFFVTDMYAPLHYLFLSLEGLANLYEELPSEFFYPHGFADRVEKSN